MFCFELKYTPHSLARLTGSIRGPPLLDQAVGVETGSGKDLSIFSKCIRGFAVFHHFSQDKRWQFHSEVGSAESFSTWNYAVEFQLKK